MKKVLFFTMLAQAAFWVISAFLPANSLGIVMKLLMAADGICFAALAFLYNRNLFLKIITPLFLAVNLILTFTDQMGLWDYIILAANVICVASFTAAMLSGRKAKA